MVFLIEINDLNKTTVDKITALWAFSEAALGGILHILKIPFTGLFVGSSAVIFISLIAYFSNSRKVIFESTLKVILVKFVVSPYTPLNAYFAVIVQSILGYILFFKGFNKISPLVLGLLALLFSAFQKIFVLTIIFGMTLWESIDIFFRFTINQLVPNLSLIKDFDLSYFIILCYIIVHILGGIFAGIYASKLPNRLSLQSVEKINLMNLELNDFLSNHYVKKKKTWWKKRFNLSFFIFSIVLIIISYFFKEIDQSISSKIIIMLIRSILIIVIWYYFLSPLLLKFLKNYLTKKQKLQAAELENIISIFPNIRAIIKYSWNETQAVKGFKRIIIFLDKVLIHYLLFEKS